MWVSNWNENSFPIITYNFITCWKKLKFFSFFSQMSSFSTTLPLQNELLNSHERFFLTKIRPFQVLTFIRTTLWAFILTLWCLRVLMVCGWEFTVRKLTFPFLRWRIEIYEIKRFRSLKTLTRGFRNWWLRKWGRKIDIFIYKMAGRFKIANWNLRGKQYWSLKFCTWEFFESLSTNACVQYAKFFSVHYEGQLSWVNLLV